MKIENLNKSFKFLKKLYNAFVDHKVQYSIKKSRPNTLFLN